MYEEMLKEIGVSSIEELFSDIPEEIREGLNLPPPKSEMEVLREAEKILSKNRKVINFAGCGIYLHYIPSAVIEIASRSEFYTSYTPYQPEISQGILQALFEYQSFMAELTGMDFANSSMYDFSTALGEAARMCYRINGRKKFFIPEKIYWEKESVLKNYVWGLGMEIVKYPIKGGKVDLESLAEMVDEDTSGVYVEIPNFYGVIDENVTKVKEILENRSLLVVGVNPLSLAVLKPPGEYGADIVIGEGQILGNPPNFGGPLLGIFASREEYARKMPGRIIGMTKDADGRRAFCMILQTREQHIRRKRATSNICTNEALCALMSAIYIAILGRSGLRKLALKNMEMARKLAEKINSLSSFTAPKFGPIFNEFVATFPYNPYEIQEYLISKGINIGLTLPKECFPELENNGMLLAATEMNTEDEINYFAEVLREYGGDE